MDEIENDHPDQAIDTDIPDPEFVDMAVWESMRDAAFEADEETPDE